MATFTNVPSVASSSYFLKIDETYYLAIDGTYKLTIQESSAGTTMTNVTKE